MNTPHSIVRWIAMLALLLLAHPAALGQRRLEKLVGPKEQSPGGPCDTSAWKLVFHDEFGGTTIDRSKWVTWFTYSEDGSDRCKGCRVMGTSNTIFRDDLVTVKDGHLVLGVRAEEGEWYGQRKQHAGGMLHSVGDARFGPGRFEVRCRIPRGAGLWPAFWGFGGETEIDVFEFCGERTKWMKGSLHRWGTRKHSNTGKRKVSDLSRDFHDYAVEWDGDAVRWYLDGTLVHQRSRYVDERGKPLPACDRPAGEYATAPYFPRSGDGINLILDLAVSEPKGYCKGPRKPKTWPADAVFEVDHVRVYQRHPDAHLRDLCTLDRRIVALDGDGRSLKAGTSQRFQVEGPHGELQWSTSDGLEVLGTGPGSITVRAKADAAIDQWIKAECPDDPCRKGSLLLRSPLQVVP